MIAVLLILNLFCKCQDNLRGIVGFSSDDSVSEGFEECLSEEKTTKHTDESISK